MTTRYLNITVSSCEPRSIVLCNGPRPQDWYCVESFTGPDASEKAGKLARQLNAGLAAQAGAA